MMPKINAFNGNDATFVPGKIYGLRSFKLSQYGTLASVTANGSWGITEKAYCARQKHWGKSAPQHKCSCGLYGYFSPENDEFYSPAYVSAVFEAHGNTIVGDKGFRAEEARLLGMSLPDDQDMRRYVIRTGVESTLLSLLVAYLLTVNYSLAENAPQLAHIIGKLGYLVFFASAAFFAGTRLSKFIRGIISWKHNRWNDKIVLRELNKNYPGVQQFTSRKELLSAYSNQLSQSQELANNVTKQKVRTRKKIDFLRARIKF